MRTADLYAPRFNHPVPYLLARKEVSDTARAVMRHQGYVTARDLDVMEEEALLGGVRTSVTITTEMLRKASA